MIGIRQNSVLSTFQRQALFIAALTFMAALAFLALLSIRFDFGECIYPSRAHPYFTSGRLMSGALIPFALLYVYGIGYLLRRVGRVASIVVVAGIIHLRLCRRFSLTALCSRASTTVFIFDFWGQSCGIEFG